MMSPTCCEITDQAFSKEEARQELRRYRKHGPPAPTREVLRAVRVLETGPATLLDIGGGIGAIYHELLPDVVRSATHVDASSAYLAEAKSETARRKHEDLVTFVHADLTAVAAQITDADVVTLDRVVCCYPDFRRLLQAAALRCRHLLVLSYPRETWYTRLALGLLNGLQWIRRSPFRSYLHSIAEMNEVLAAEGLHRSMIRRLPIWEIAAYQRS